MVLTGSMNGKLKTCPFCQYKSHSLVKISDHLRNDHYQGKNKNGEEFECEKCPQKTAFGSMQMLKNHFHLVHATANSDAPPKKRPKLQNKKSAKKRILKRGHKSKKSLKSQASNRMNVEPEHQKQNKLVLRKASDKRKIPLKCELCDFEWKFHNLPNENFTMREHMVRVHFKDKLNQLLPQTHPFKCPECDWVGEIKTHLFRHYLGKHDLYDKFLTQALENKTKSRFCLHCKENSTGRLCITCLWKLNPIVIVTDEDIENCAESIMLDNIVEEPLPTALANDNRCELIQTDYVDNIIEESMSIVTYDALELSVNGVNAHTENEPKHIDPPIEEIVENVSVPLVEKDFEDVSIINSSVTSDIVDTEYQQIQTEAQNSQQDDDDDETIKTVSNNDTLAMENTENVTVDNFDTNSRIKAMITKLKNQRKWQCRHCFKWFASKRNYKSHMKWIHDKFKRISCSKCPEKFYEKLLFVSHYKDKHRGGAASVSLMTPQESDTIEQQQEKEIEDEKISDCVTDTIGDVLQENDTIANTLERDNDKTSGPGDTLQSQFVMNEDLPNDQPDPVQYDMLPIFFYGCDKCQLTFPDAVQLHEHSKTHVSQLMKMKTERVQMQVYRCALCAYFTHSSSDMISHSFQNHIIVQDVTFDVETVE